MDVSYKEAYAMNPEQARMKLVETYLVCGSIAETPQGVCLFPPLVLDRISADWALAWALGLTRNCPPDSFGIFAPREKMEQG